MRQIDLTDERPDWLVHQELYSPPRHTFDSSGVSAARSGGALHQEFVLEASEGTVNRLFAAPASPGSGNAGAERVHDHLTRKRGARARGRSLTWINRGLAGVSTARRRFESGARNHLCRTYMAWARPSPTLPRSFVFSGAYSRAPSTRRGIFRCAGIFGRCSSQ